MAEKKVRRALGRGLQSLIPVGPEGGNEEQSAISELDIESIRPNPFQPRTDFSEEEIQRLADSIRSQGLLQPILVRRTVSGFEIVSGERRFRAVKQLGEKKISGIIREQLSDREMLEMALVENIQRENLNEIDKAHAYDKLIIECGLSHEQLSERVGVSRSAVTNTLRLLKLPPQIQDMVRKGAISMGHARALLSLDDARRQQQLAEKIIAEDLSVRAVEEVAQKSGHAVRKKGTEKHEGKTDPDTRQIIEKLQYKFGTAVAIIAGPSGKGSIDITFYSKNDLNRILDILLK